MKPTHYLKHGNWYACNQAIGNEIKGIATKNPKLVTCKNCQKYTKKIIQKNKKVKI